MALFAKRIDYGASMTSYVALLAIAKKKGGTPISYIVYGYNITDEPFVMLPFFTYDEAKQNTYPPLWKEDGISTTAWLYPVAVGGAYQRHPEGTWVRVPTPRLVARKRGKKIPKFGDLGELYRIAKKEHAMLKQELIDLSSMDGCSYEDIYWIMMDDGEFSSPSLQFVEAYNAERVAEMRVTNLRCEMEHARAKRTGIPISPNSWGTMVMRSQD